MYTCPKSIILSAIVMPVLALVVSTASAQQSVPTSKVPENVRSALEQAVEGRNFSLSRSNTPFFAGLVSGLLAKCQVQLAPAKTAELAAWSASGYLTMQFGTDRDNRDHTKSTTSMMNSMVGVIAGKSFADYIRCDPTSERLISAVYGSLKRQEQRQPDGESWFIKSCKHAHGVSKCECVASVLRGTFPNIHTTAYSRMLIKQAIKRNPLSGFAIGLCGVVRY
ncbi:MAG: hypothetical protein AAFY84_18290 [Pseudomonadota bacterium]